MLNFMCGSQPLFRGIDRGIKHDFVIYKHSQGPSIFTRDLANVNEFDRYHCINSTKHCENEENIGALYFITSSHFPTRERHT